MHIKFLSLGALVIGPFLAYGAYSEKKKYDRLVAEGTKVPGMITEGESRTGRKRRGQDLTIAYSPGEGKAPISKKFSVKRAYFDSHTEGNYITDAPVTIAFDPAAPSEAVVVDGTDAGMALAYIGSVAGVLGAIGTWFFFLRGRGKQPAISDYAPPPIPAAPPAVPPAVPGGNNGNGPAAPPPLPPS